MKKLLLIVLAGGLLSAAQAEDNLPMAGGQAPGTQNMGYPSSTDNSSSGTGEDGTDSQVTRTIHHGIQATDTAPTADSGDTYQP